MSATGIGRKAVKKSGNEVGGNEANYIPKTKTQKVGEKNGTTRGV